MAEYEIEPGVFYGKQEGAKNVEYIKYKKGNDELFVSISEYRYIPTHDYEDQTDIKYYTDVNIHTVKERKEPGLVNKIRQKLVEKPKTETIREDIFSNRYDGKMEDFIQNPSRVINENQPDIKKIFEKTCELIIKKGRPTYEMEQANKKDLTHNQKAQQEITVNKMVADKVKGFLE